MPFVMLPVNGFRKKHQSQGERLCLSALTQARSITFYEKWGIADTLEGRFDCASLHLILLLRYVKGPLAQTLFDAFFSYTDLTLREIGVSDLSVGKQVKKCASFFYGALKAYNVALDQQKGLEEAISRNLYGRFYPPSLKEITSYVIACDHLLRTQDLEKTISPEWPHID